MNAVRHVQITFDCASPARVATFCGQVLGYTVDVDSPDDPNSDAACFDPGSVGPRLFFQRVPEAKTVKNRVHLDVRVGTGLTGTARLAALEEECARLIGVGAERVALLPADEENESTLVMRDIEGNEFCLD